MVNFCSNAMWLIRQAIPPGVLGGEEEKKKEQGQDQKSESVTVNAICLQKEVERRFANK